MGTVSIGKERASRAPDPRLPDQTLNPNPGSLRSRLSRCYAPYNPDPNPNPNPIAPLQTHPNPDPIRAISLTLTLTLTPAQTLTLTLTPLPSHAAPAAYLPDLPPLLTSPPARADFTEPGWFEDLGGWESPQAAWLRVRVRVRVRVRANPNPYPYPSPYPNPNHYPKTLTLADKPEPEPENLESFLWDFLEGAQVLGLG